MDIYNRHLAAVGALFGFIGLLMAILAIRLPNWTIEYYPRYSNATWISYGLFQQCRSSIHGDCPTKVYDDTLAIVLAVFGSCFLLAGTVFTMFYAYRPFFRRHYYISPVTLFLSWFLFFWTLCAYGSESLLNYHSSRLLMSTTVFIMVATIISSYIAGRYFEGFKENKYDKDFHNEKKKKIEKSNHQRDLNKKNGYNNREVVDEVDETKAKQNGVNQNDTKEKVVNENDGDQQEIAERL
ncbi:unnamed protein product [Didymodactylos carnosus]|uniref:Uncharacterized protein n=1 Tax=Didymodactylos carnosus TaxID=1234261 RepID=A0A815Q584_9BILA|nr:unnamed protein product [Didymodactylos carnosus]CAF1458990.1 unnamed protein product [Didymodactylos carnosus]CAF4114858.1 unnamed protein product [Didymodactylos carnosus]CAF4329876.1 unnamed protein product [Didymodactylos carnosus]